MTRKLQSKLRSHKTHQPLGQGKNGTLPFSDAEKFCTEKLSSSKTQVGRNIDDLDVPSILEQLIGQVIRDFFKDPQNECIIDMIQNSDRKKVPRSGSQRDISKNEIIRPRDLPQVTGLSKTNIWRLERAGLFAKKLKLSNGCVGYYRADIQAWLEDRHILKGEQS